MRLVKFDSDQQEVYVNPKNVLYVCYEKRAFGEVVISLYLVGDRRIYIYNASIDDVIRALEEE